MPSEISIRCVMDELGYDYLVARRHVQQRDELRRRKAVRAPVEEAPDPGSIADFAERIRQHLPHAQPIKWPEQIKRKVLRVETPLANKIRAELGEERWAELNKEWL